MYEALPSPSGGYGTITFNCTDNPADCLPRCPGGNCVDYAAPPPPLPSIPRAPLAVDHRLPVRLLLTVSLLSAFLFLSLALATLLLYRRRRALRRRRRSATAPLPHGEGFGDDGDEEAGGGGGGGGGEVHHVWYIRTVGLDEAHRAVPARPHTSPAGGHGVINVARISSGGGSVAAGRGVRGGELSGRGVGRLRRRGVGGAVVAPVRVGVASGAASPNASFEGGRAELHKALHSTFRCRDTSLHAQVQDSVSFTNIGNRGGYRQDNDLGQLTVSEFQGDDVVCMIKNSVTLTGSLFTLHCFQIHIDFTHTS